MATANLSSSQSVDTTNDSVVIVSVLGTVPGGRTLDISGFTDGEISAGHVIIKETATGTFKPLPIDGVKPADHTYEGYLIASIKASNAQAAIMDQGKVNEAYCKYPIPAGAKTSISLVKIIDE